MSLKDFVFLQLQPYRIPMPITLTCQLQIASPGGYQWYAPNGGKERRERWRRAQDYTHIWGLRALFL